MNDTNTPDKVIDTHDTPIAPATLKGRRVDVFDTYVACLHCPNDTHHDSQFETIEDNDEKGHYVLVPWLDIQRFKAENERLKVELAFAEHLEKETVSMREVELTLQMEDAKDKHKSEKLAWIAEKEKLNDEVNQLEMTLSALREWINNLSASNYDLQTELESWEDLAAAELDLNDLYYLAVNQKFFDRIVKCRGQAEAASPKITLSRFFSDLELTDDEIDSWGRDIP